MWRCKIIMLKWRYIVLEVKIRLNCHTMKCWELYFLLPNWTKIDYQKVDCRWHVGVFTVKANIWIFIQMRISLTLDRACAIWSPLLLQVYLRQVAHLPFRTHALLRHNRRQRSPTALNCIEHKRHAAQRAVVIPMPSGCLSAAYSLFSVSKPFH